MVWKKNSKKPGVEEREYRRYESDRERNAREAPVLRHSGYRRIFPLTKNRNRMTQYVEMISTAKDLSDRFAFGRQGLNRQRSTMSGPGSFLKKREISIYDYILEDMLEGEDEEELQREQEEDKLDNSERAANYERDR